MSAWFFEDEVNRRAKMWCAPPFGSQRFRQQTMKTIIPEEDGGLMAIALEMKCAIKLLPHCNSLGVQPSVVRRIKSLLVVRQVTGTCDWCLRDWYTPFQSATRGIVLSKNRDGRARCPSLVFSPPAFLFVCVRFMLNFCPKQKRREHRDVEDRTGSIYVS